MAGRIVLFGATGYTGRATARALAAHGAAGVVLAGRNRGLLETLAAELGAGYAVAEADAARPHTVRALVERGDVLVSTVGPFLRHGHAAVDAAVDAGAAYLDSTGEGTFIRAVFEEHGPRAVRSDAVLLTALGYDYVPGNLAGALALHDAGPATRRLDIGYFLTGPPVTSGGTRASVAEVALRPGHAFRDGRLVEEPLGARQRRFDVDGRALTGVSVPGSEQLALPALDPELREVGVYLGAPPAAAQALRVLGSATALAMRAPGLRRGLGALAGRALPGSTGGPGEEQLARSRSRVVAIAADEGGAPLAEVRLEGPNPYDFTAHFLAWAARTAAAGRIHGPGALGPVAAFGREELEAGCAEAGLTRAA